MHRTLTHITQRFFRPLRHCRLSRSVLKRSALGRKLSDESGIGTIEMVLLLVVLIALVLIFKEHIKTLLDTIMLKINESAKSVWD